MNGKKATPPCPCGFLGHASKPCTCTPGIVQRYRSRLSGPLLDRIDLQVEVPSLADDEIEAAARGEPSASVRERVCRARVLQLRRQGAPNARLAGREIDARVRPGTEARALLRRAAARLVLSARAHQRLLKVARTIADLDGCADVGEPHVAEALSYRVPPRQS